MLFNNFFSCVTIWQTNKTIIRKFIFHGVTVKRYNFVPSVTFYKKIFNKINLVRVRNTFKKCSELLKVLLNEHSKKEIKTNWF